MKSGKISLKDTTEFTRGGFSGYIYFPENSDTGFGALEVRVLDSHPQKTVENKLRMYRVEEGKGTFTIDDTSYKAEVGDLFLIFKGSSYSYEGKMKLFEINIPA